MSTLSNVTDGQLCDDAGLPGCAPKIVVQDNAAKTVTVSNPTTVVTQTGGARITTSPSNTQVVTTSQSPQVVVNSSATTVINTGCCSDEGGNAEVGGADTQIQFNDAGLLAGDPTLVFDKTSKVLGAQAVETAQVRFPSVDGLLTANPPAVTQAETKVMVVADSQTVGESIDFGDVVVAAGIVTATHFYAWGVYCSGAPGEYATLKSNGLSFATYTSGITIVPNGDMVDSINVVWPALSGTLARIEDIPGAGANNVNRITAVDGLLTLDFAEKAKEVFIVSVNQDITDVAFTNLPSDDYLELEIHFYQRSPGGYTITLSNRFGKLSGSDADLQAASWSYTILKASSVTGGYNWRYTLNASTEVAFPPE